MSFAAKIHPLFFLQERYMDLACSGRTVHELSHHQILEAAPDAILVCDAAGILVYVNLETERLFGYPRAELLGRPIEILVPMEQREEHVRSRAAYAAAPAPRMMSEGLKIDAVRKDGSIFAADVKLNPLKTPSGLLVVATVQHITARAERRLDAERFRQTFESAPIGMVLLDTEGSIVRGNHAFAEMLGYSLEELVTTRWSDVTHPEDLEIDQELFQKLARAEIPHYSVKKRYFRRDGSVVHGELHVAIVRDESGRPVHAIGQILDVTARERAYEALQASEERLRHLAAQLPVSVFEATLGGEITFVNERWCNHTGLAPQDAMGHGWHAAIHPDDRARVQEAWRSLSEQQREIRVELRVLAPGAEPRWAWLDAAPLRGADGRIQAYFGALLDIDDRKRIEELLRESLAQRELIAAQKERLSELSTPIVPLRDDVVAMPLVGVIDRERADRVLEALLARVSGGGVRVAILDITGVLTVDQQVAEALVRAARAVRLLGAQLVLSGIRPEVARTLVEIGADLTGIVTCANLQTAITYAMTMTESPRAAAARLAAR